MAVALTAANVQDRDAATDVAAQACTKAPGRTVLYTDGADSGKWAQAIEHAHGLRVQVVRRLRPRAGQEAQLPLWPDIAPKTGFVVQAKRWVVERTHAWNERARRFMGHHDHSN